MKCGLKSSNFPDEMVANLNTEEELEGLINSVNSGDVTRGESQDGEEIQES